MYLQQRMNQIPITNENIILDVPMDLNSSVIMRELSTLYGMLGSPDYENEFNLAVLTDKIIQKLEIYDQVWVARDAGNTVQMENGIRHSKQGIALAQEIIEFLEEDEGCAETFPYETIERLSEEWNL